MVQETNTQKLNPIIERARLNIFGSPMFNKDSTEPQPFVCRFVMYLDICDKDQKYLLGLRVKS